MLQGPMLQRVLQRVLHLLAVLPQPAEQVLLPVPQQAGRLLRFWLLIPLPLRRLLPRRRLRLPCLPLAAASASRIG